ncbi:TPA_asm: UL19.4 sORF [Human alphaherpesvirus 1]|nr:TPA_asm: UL19.4 sORF [Human alphaherpesvirus 1]
MAPTRG